MSKKKLKPEELKTKLSIRINPKLFKLINDTQPNKSKYFEWLAYQNLLENNIINKNILI